MVSLANMQERVPDRMLLPLFCQWQYEHFTSIGDLRTRQWELPKQVGWWLSGRH